jgi:hypothetical protein
MTQSQEPFLHDDDVVVPRQYICDTGGSVTGRDTAEGIEIESSQETRQLQPSPAWQHFSERDPLLPLIGSLEDSASDVSQNKYVYLANAYRP